MVKLRSLVLLAALIALGGCSTTRPLMPTPHLYAEGHAQLFGELSPALKSTTLPLFYVTDRAPTTDESGRLQYGYERSASLAYGEATIEIGEGLTWEQVLEASSVRERDTELGIELRGLREIGRTPPTPYPFTPRGGFFDYDPQVMSQAREVEREFREEIKARLALTPRKEVLLYVHGYNNDFRDAALTWAGVWHFFGREGVPMLYTWPAGRGGLTGYAYDSASGEYTLHHLKMLLHALASFPEVEGLRILAHSRGTAVTTTALRELFSESRAAGVDPRDRFKIRHVVLAAPDLDMEVIQQRLMTEPIAIGVGSTTVYVSPTDKALGLAEWLFGGIRRLGRVQAKDFTTDERTRLKAIGNIDIIELKGDGGSFGHSYFHENPAVSSDLYLAMRFERAAGAEQGRPLQRQGAHFWLITDDYLLAGP